MARSKALSGGPVYLSDSPVDFTRENILPLIDEEGKLFRPEAPAIPTPESIITNPLQGGKAYRVFAPTGDEAVSLICYNLNTSPQHRKVQATISRSDYLLRETMTGKPIPQNKRIILYDWDRTDGQRTGYGPADRTGRFHRPVISSLSGKQWLGGYRSTGEISVAGNRQDHLLQPETTHPRCPLLRNCPCMGRIREQKGITQHSGNNSGHYNN